MTKKPFVTKEQLEEIAKIYPTPFHIYDERGIRENVRALKEAFSWNKGYKANSPRHAIRLFCEKYGISRRIIRTSDLLKIVYVVRPGGKHGFLGFRVSGLEWKKDFETLQKKSFFH